VTGAPASYRSTTQPSTHRPTSVAVVGLRPIGDNGAVAADDDRTGAFRGASFTGADFTGATFRDCDLRQVKITDSWLPAAGIDVRSGWRGAM
jgi:Pentapeptide repeats (8 copies)